MRFMEQYTEPKKLINSEEFGGLTSITVVGGMVFSTFLTLFVVPAIYTYISSESKTKTDENKVSAV